jgi:hypothetical protein
LNGIDLSSNPQLLTDFFLNGQASFTMLQCCQVFHYYQLIIREVFSKFCLDLNEGHQLKKKKTLVNHAERNLKTLG